MARSRTGGTGGMLSGKLGSVIYSITRNADGTFRQTMQSNPESRFNPSTFDQARARCTMATIERAMFTFRDFITTGWEGVESGQQSVSEFSRYNYNAIKDFLEVMFDDDTDYEVGWNLPKRGQTQPRAGGFRLSQGSLKLRRHWFLDFGGLSTPYWCVRSWPTAGDITLGHWLNHNGLLLGDQLVFIQFMEGVTPSKAMVTYLIVATEKNTNPNTIITSSNYKQLLTLKSNVPCNAVFDNTTKVLRVEFLQGEAYGLKCLSMDTVRLRREINGKICYNTADLFAESEDPVRDYGWQGMRAVRPSWLDGPSPSPRIPAEYQEVGWIKKISTTQWVWSAQYNPYFMEIETFVMVQQLNQLFIIGASYNTQVACLQANSSIIYFSQKDRNGTTKTYNLSSPNLGNKSYYKYTPNDEGFTLVSDFGNLDVSDSSWPTSTALGALRLFGINNQTSNVTLWEIIIRNVQTEQVIHDLVPCYRKSDSLAGFYDLTTSQFVTGGAAVGDFEIGPDVNV